MDSSRLSACMRTDGARAGCWLGGLLMLATWAAAFGVPATPPPSRSVTLSKLTAEQVVSKNVAARGGLDAWRKVQTMVWVGHLQSEHAPVPSMGFVLEQKRPNSTRFQLLALKARSIRVFDGHQGWKTRPSSGSELNVVPYSLQEVRFAQSAPGMDGPLIDYQAKGNRIELVGLENIEGREAWHLHVMLPSGERDEIWIDERTYLDLRYDRVPVTDNALPGRPVSVIYRDYKKIDGLQIPSLIETGAGAGSVPDRMVVERIVINAPLDDQIFTKPGRARTPPRRLGAPQGRAIMGDAAAPTTESATAPAGSP